MTSFQRLSTPHWRHRRRAIAVAAMLCAAAAAASAQETQRVVVTGNPLRDDGPRAAASVLQGTALVLQRGSALGETLDGLPGVSASYFGPNANRPIVRGQDGDRIRVLANGGASLDASALSFDHAVPIDPLAVERIEVLRGPAALLYGGSAVGGVVNTIDNRIPAAPEGPVSGAVELRGGGASAERGAAALVEGGGDGFALHADAFTRRTDDLRVPAFDRPDEDGGSVRGTRIANSASDADGGAVGASWFGTRGRIGLSLDRYRSTYGTVAEADVTIGMRRDRLAIEGEVAPAAGPFATVRGQAAWTDYVHTEFEGDEVGTVFRNRGHDGRLEAVHRTLDLAGGRLDGVVGLQVEQSRFVADGEEAFVPTTHGTQTGLFVVERWRRGGTGLSAGLRQEQVRVRSDGDAPDAEAPRFGDAMSRRFSPRVVAIGATQTLAPGWDLGLDLSQGERAPTSYELFADGVHVATAAYERGDPAQAMERGRHAELSLGWSQGPSHLRISVFHSRFDRYIALLPTGETAIGGEDGEVEELPVYAFESVRATLRGAELDGRWRALDGDGWRLDLGARADLLRADDRSHGQPLPRIAPRRLSLSADLQRGPWGLELRWRHAARQDRVPADDVPTAGWSMVDVALTWETAVGGGRVLCFLRATNLGDVLAYNASTTATLRALSPLPGRALSAGARWTF